MEGEFLTGIILVFGLAILVLVLFSRLRLPSLTGFLIVGILVGPHGFGVIRATQEVEMIAEIGVILLLFTIGLEFSLERLTRIRRLMGVAGPIQVLTVVAGVTAAGAAWGLHWKTALFWGFLISLSSTAIVLKLLSDRSILDSPHGQTSVGILIFQDLCIIPMIFLTPFLSHVGTETESLTSLGTALLKSAAAIAGIILVGRFLLPRLLEGVVRQRSRELFLMAVLFLCLGTAWLTSSVGLSLALGAFIAGLILSESEYSHQALSDILPFRDSFGSLFFISIGMLFDWRLFLNEPVLILALIAGILGIKFVSTALATLAVGYPARIAVLTGLSLAQIGEFSFVLSQYGISEGIFGEHDYQMFLASSVITMLLTPGLMAAAPRLAERVGGQAPELQPAGEPPPSDHVVIVGFGVNGQNVARVLKRAGIVYRTVEMNPETVMSQRKQGEPIFFGDASRTEVLLHAGVDRARAMVIAISDPPSSRRVTYQARRLNPTLHIIVRTRYVREMEPLYRDGANEVIPEEYETSVEIFARLLRNYLLPQDAIDRYVAEIRDHGYEMFRKLRNTRHAPSWLETGLPGVEVESFRVRPESEFRGKRLEELQLRGRTGVTVVAVRRGEQTYPNPDGKFTFEEGDLLIGLGDRESLARLARFMAAG